MLALLAHVYKVQTLQQASGHLALLICLAQLLPSLVFQRSSVEFGRWSRRRDVVGPAYGKSAPGEIDAPHF